MGTSSSDCCKSKTVGEVFDDPALFAMLEKFQQADKASTLKEYDKAYAIISDASPHIKDLSDEHVQDGHLHSMAISQRKGTYRRKMNQLQEAIEEYQIGIEIGETKIQKEKEKKEREEKEEKERLEKEKAEKEASVYSATLNTSQNLNLAAVAASAAGGAGNQKKAKPKPKTQNSYYLLLHLMCECGALQASCHMGLILACKRVLQVREAQQKKVLENENNNNNNEQQQNPNPSFSSSGVSDAAFDLAVSNSNTSFGHGNNNNNNNNKGHHGRGHHNHHHHHHEEDEVGVELSELGADNIDPSLSNASFAMPRPPSSATNTSSQHGGNNSVSASAPPVKSALKNSSSSENNQAGGVTFLDVPGTASKNKNRRSSSNNNGGGDESSSSSSSSSGARKSNVNASTASWASQNNDEMLAAGPNSFSFAASMAQNILTTTNEDGEVTLDVGAVREAEGQLRTDPVTSRLMGLPDAALEQQENLNAISAEQILLRCITLVEELQNRQSELLMAPLFRLADLYEAIGMMDNCERCVRRLVGIGLVKYGHDHEIYLKQNHRLGQLEQQKEDRKTLKAAVMIGKTWKMKAQMKRLRSANARSTYEPRRHTRAQRLAPPPDDEAAVKVLAQVAELEEDPPSERDEEEKEVNEEIDEFEDFDPEKAAAFLEKMENKDKAAAAAAAKK